MTSDRDFKRVVRARMAKTGEAYAAARAQLTKPARGERFETAVAGDGSAVFRMFTKLQTPEKGWSGLAVPSEFLGLRRSAWLRGTVNGLSFWVSAQPMGDGNHWVTMNREMRAEMGLVGDEEVEVEFAIADGPPALEVPDDVQEALDTRPEAKAFFEQMSHNHRKEYLRWIGEAKRAETRSRRIATAVEEIIATRGKSGR
jgi:hypothetical protein